VKNPRADENEPPKNFTFDAVFGSNAEQKNIYDICASGVVESVLNGYNGTIFAYGQVICTIYLIIIFQFLNKYNILINYIYL